MATEYTWTIDGDRILILDPSGERLVTLDVDEEDLKVRSLEEIATTDAADLVKHLNRPEPCTAASEYTVTKMGTDWKYLAEENSRDLNRPIIVEAPNGDVITFITDFNEGAALVKHFSRGASPSRC